MARAAPFWRQAQSLCEEENVIGSLRLFGRATGAVLAHLPVLLQLALQRPQADAEDLGRPCPVAAGLVQGAEDGLLLDLVHPLGRTLRRGGRRPPPQRALIPPPRDLGKIPQPHPRGAA